MRAIAARAGATGAAYSDYESKYRCGLSPDLYWALWADGLIHRIHERVLGHIRDEVTRSAAAPVAP